MRNGSSRPTPIPCCPHRLVGRWGGGRRESCTIGSTAAAARRRMWATAPPAAHSPRVGGGGRFAGAPHTYVLSARRGAAAGQAVTQGGRRLASRIVSFTDKGIEASIRRVLGVPQSMRSGGSTMGSDGLLDARRSMEWGQSSRSKAVSWFLGSRVTTFLAGSRSAAGVVVPSPVRAGPDRGGRVRGAGRRRRALRDGSSRRGATGGFYLSRAGKGARVPQAGGLGWENTTRARQRYRHSHRPPPADPTGTGRHTLVSSPVAAPSECKSNSPPPRVRVLSEALIAHTGPTPHGGGAAMPKQWLRAAPPPSVQEAYTPPTRHALQQSRPPPLSGGVACRKYMAACAVLQRSCAHALIP